MPERFTVERKGALSLWSAKTCDVYKDGSVALYDAGADKSTIKRLAIVSHSIGDDPLVVILQARGEDVAIRFGTAEERTRFTDLMHKGITTRSKILQLPPTDPRNGIPFIDVPSAFLGKFGDLERAVLYWFAPITKYGAPSTFSRSYSTEERIAFCSDTAFYITKPNSEVTRCLRISQIEEVITNEGTDSDPFLGIRLQRPDYDVLLSGPTVDQLLTCILRLYKSSQMGKAIDVSHAKSVADVPLDKLMLKRPGGYSMKLIVPTQRDKLRKALDEFGKKNNLKFTDEGVVVSPNQGSAAAPTTGQPSSANGKSQRSPATRPIASGTPPPATSAVKSTTSPLQQQQQQDPYHDLPPELRENRLFMLLDSVGCAKYFQLLYSQNVDIDIVECMDETDLRTYGIQNTAHVNKIMEAIAQIHHQHAAAAKESSGSRPSPDPKLQQQSQPSATTSTASRVLSPSQPLPPATRVSVPITLSDSDLDEDDDDDLDVVPFAGRGASGSGGMKIVLSSDDDDDDLPPPPPAAAAPNKPAAAAVVLDEDDL